MCKRKTIILKQIENRRNLPVFSENRTRLNGMEQKNGLANTITAIFTHCNTPAAQYCCNIVYNISVHKNDCKTPCSAS